MSNRKVFSARQIQLAGLRFPDVDVTKIIEKYHPGNWDELTGCCRRQQAPLLRRRRLDLMKRSQSTRSPATKATSQEKKTSREQVKKIFASIDVDKIARQNPGIDKDRLFQLCAIQQSKKLHDLSRIGRQSMKTRIIQDNQFPVRNPRPIRLPQKGERMSLDTLFQLWKIPLFDLNNIPFNPNRTPSSSDHKDGLCYVIYHGTTDDCADKILSTGSRVDMAFVKKYGSGFYCTPEFRLAVEYARDRNKRDKSKNPIVIQYIISQNKAKTIFGESADKDTNHALNVGVDFTFAGKQPILLLKTEQAVNKFDFFRLILIRKEIDGYVFV